MKIVRLTLSCLLASLTSIASFAQVEIQDLNYWKFSIGANSPNTSSYKDSLNVISKSRDTTVFIINSYRIAEYLSTDTFLYTGSVIYGDSVIFDENLAKGDTFFSVDRSLIINEVKDTTLNDGVLRKMWKMRSIEFNWYHASWIQGIGELRQGMNWNPMVFIDAGPATVASICNGDSLILWQPFSYPGGPDPSCDFDYLDTYLGMNKPSGSDISSGFYPNPTDGKLFFKNDFNGLQYQIFGSDGRVKLSGILNNEIDLQNFPSGIYFIKITQEDSILNERLIIR
ncbi:T9SS type A sorting domain-containing protein [bacterium]|nr:T9SS type A sorting domain-containing protein [bacterium]